MIGETPSGLSVTHSVSPAAVIEKKRRKREYGQTLEMSDCVGQFLGFERHSSINVQIAQRVHIREASEVEG